MIVKKDGKKYKASIFHDKEFDRDYPCEPYEEIIEIDPIKKRLEDIEKEFGDALERIESKLNELITK